ncbi:MAG TPA: enoyl-CoA hydratase-related protein [Burkholderiaceae bacterium]
MDTLELHIDARGVARLTMNRPERFNAFDEAMIGELGAAFAQLGADTNCRLVVLAGAGKHFSAGADVGWMQRAAAASREANVEDARRFAAMLQTIYECPKPVLARVQGLALGGGVGLAAACDIAIASVDAKFAVSEARLGILPAVIGPYLVNAVGPRQAKRLALMAGRIGAAEALAMGLVQEVADDLDAAIERCVDELLASGPEAQREIKALLSQLQPGEIDAATRELTAQTIARVRGGAEAREGFAAFMAKRPAAWVPNKET